MAELKDKNYISIQAFMVKDLGLSGNELITYALIYGFSQDGENYFRGSLSYIAEWLNCSKNTACNIVKSLVQKGVLIKKEKEINKVKFCEYMAVVPEDIYDGENNDNNKNERYPKKLDTHTKNLDGGIQKICTNKLKDNILDNYSKDNSFFAKKVADRNKIFNPAKVNQDDLKKRILEIGELAREEVLADNEADNVEACMLYFVEQYAEVFGQKHPEIAEKSIYDVIARITESTEFERDGYKTVFKPLVSNYEGDNSYEEIIDMYFETEFSQKIDYSIVHFTQEGVLTKLMGKARENSWFRNE